MRIQCTYWVCDFCVLLLLSTFSQLVSFACHSQILLNKTTGSMISLLPFHCFSPHSCSRDHIYWEIIMLNHGPIWTATFFLFGQRQIKRPYWLSLAVKVKATGDKCQTLRLLSTGKNVGCLEQDIYSELARVDLDVSNEVIINDASKHRKWSQIQSSTLSHTKLITWSRFHQSLNKNDNRRVV